MISVMPKLKPANAGSRYRMSPFELERSQVELLRATGDLERWALGAK